MQEVAKLPCRGRTGIPIKILSCRHTLICIPTLLLESRHLGETDRGNGAGGTDRSSDWISLHAEFCEVQVSLLFTAELPLRRSLGIALKGPTVWYL